jgi:hypothetical protein
MECKLIHNSMNGNVQNTIRRIQDFLGLDWYGSAFFRSIAGVMGSKSFLFAHLGFRLR